MEVDAGTVRGCGLGGLGQTHPFLSTYGQVEMSGRAVLSYVTAEQSPGRWGVMGSSQFGHIIPKYPGHIHRGVCAELVYFLKFRY